MDIKNYKFEIGDKVITVLGETGKIVDICKCDSCAKRGFYEPVWANDENDWEEYITVHQAEFGFNNFYQIGKYHFSDFDKAQVLRTMARYEDELKLLRKQLKIIEEHEV